MNWSLKEWSGEAVLWITVRWYSLINGKVLSIVASVTPQR